MIAEKILIVDDDPSILEGYKRSLRKRFSLEIASTAELGLRILAAGTPFAVVVSDMKMPKMNGIEFLSRVKEKVPGAVRIMLTGFADQQTAIEAVNEGNIFRFLTKPCPTPTFEKALEAGIEQHRLITAERDLLEKTLSGAITILTEILSLFDPDLFGRAMQLKELIHQLSRFLKIPPPWDIEAAAMLSQIGHLGIPPETLVKVQKRQSLSHEEKEILTLVPEIGSHLLVNIPRLDSVSRIVLYQNKRFDGSGFPKDSIAGTQIPLGARLLKVFSDLVEIESNGTSRKDAFRQLQSREGWYDPEIIKKISRFFSDQEDYETGNKSSSVSICLGDLRPGHLLKSDIQTSDGLLLLSAGHRISPVHLARLRNCAKLREIKEPIKIEKLIPDSD
ncbi:MAG: HD domain-containing phosphohydrolase [Nitrospinaceae bacterium]